MSVPHFISPPCLSHLVFHISVLLSAIPLPPLIGLSAHHRSMGIHVSARNCDHDSPYGETKPLPPPFLSLSLSLFVRLAKRLHLRHKLIILCILCLHKNKHFSAEVAKIKASWRSCEMSVTGCASLSCLILSCKHAHTNSKTHMHTHWFWRVKWLSNACIRLMKYICRRTCNLVAVEMCRILLHKALLSPSSDFVYFICVCFVCDSSISAVKAPVCKHKEWPLRIPRGAVRYWDHNPVLSPLCLWARHLTPARSRWGAINAKIHCCTYEIATNYAGTN